MMAGGDGVEVNEKDWHKQENSRYKVFEAYSRCIAKSLESD